MADGTRPIQRNYFFIPVLNAVTAGATLILSGFWTTIFWGILLGILFQLLKNALSQRLAGRSSLAAVITVFLVFLLVLGPALAILSTVIEQALMLLRQAQSGDTGIGKAADQLRALVPKAGKVVTYLGLDLENIKARVNDMQVGAARYAVGVFVGGGRGAIGFAFHLVMLLYLLLFMVRGGPQIYQAI